MTQDQLKQAVAQAAVDLIVPQLNDRSIVGVGTGSTANFFIDLLAKHKGAFDGAVASSDATAERLKGHGIPVYDLNSVAELEFYVDGADETNRHLELIKGGVTTVADMYYFEAEVGRVAAQAGFRAIVGQTLADFNPPDHKDFDQGFNLVDELVDEFADHPLVTPSIAPHAPYSTGLQVMERVARWSCDHPGVPVQIHLAESTLEVNWARDTHGKSTVAVTRDAGLLKPNLICAHCLQLDNADITMMSEHQVCVATNPRSNGKAGRGIAPVERLRNAGLPVGIGSDGAMSGNTLDLFSQFAPVSMFAKLLAGNRQPLPARDVVRMATIEGARVLSLNLKTGSLEPGKQADLIRIALSAPRLHPIYDPYAMLVFACMPSDVRDTMVAGKWLMRDRQVQTLDADKALRDAIQIAKQFKAEMRQIDAGAA